MDDVCMYVCMYVALMCNTNMSPGIVEAVRIGEAGSSEKFKQWKSAKPGLPSGYVKIAIENHHL